MKLESKMLSGANLDYNDYLFTVLSPVASTFTLRANNYPSGSVYPHQMFTSGESLGLSYSDSTKHLNIYFDGLKCD